MANQNDSFSMEQLQKILAFQAEQNRIQMEKLAETLRKPLDPTPEQLAEKESNDSMRRATAESELQRIASRKREQAACSHLRRDGTSSCVFIYGDPSQPNQGNYVICQQCNGKIRPEPRPTGLLAREWENDIFDTNLFNIHFVKSQASMTTF